MNELLKDLWGRLGNLIDPETGRSLDSANLILDMDFLQDGTIQIIYSPFSPASPVAVNLGKEIRSAVLSSSPERRVKVICQGHFLDEVVNRLVNIE